MTTKQSLIKTGLYILLALFSAVLIHQNMGSVASSQFITIFTLEKLLSMDNLLVIYMIFKYFGIPKADQALALTLGIIGAVVFRVLIILSGTYIIEHFHWILYVFAAFLIYSGAAMLGASEDDQYNPDSSKIVSFIKSKTGTLGVFAGCILAIELSDIMFAVDSIPASFGVSQNAFIILSANILAVMGLRALYHAVANGIEFFKGIEKYIGGILFLIGANVFVSNFWMKIPETYLMGSVFVILATGAIICNKKKKEV